MSERSVQLGRLQTQIRELLSTRPNWSRTDEAEYETLTAMEAALLSLRKNDDGPAKAGPPVGEQDRRYRY